MAISVETILKNIEMTNLTPDLDITKTQIENGYVSDLLSDVMGSSQPNQIWVTIMRHLNTIAVASMTEIPVILFAKDIIPEQSVIDKAREEGIILLTSPLTVFDLTGKIYTLLNN
ncbi:MAG: hypothetical protein P9L91_01375 [Candidatus Zophobacter franzmannii]|nr:hypothetical protein [Candidatus Zophobacter franzmannii]